MNLKLPVKELLNKSRNSVAVIEFIEELKKGYCEKIKGGYELMIEEKVFHDAIYLNIRPFGLSMCFDLKKGMGGETSSNSLDDFLLKAVHVFANSRDYADCPLEIPECVNLSWRARDIVQHLGEPEKKCGGGNIPISLTYLSHWPKLEVI